MGHLDIILKGRTKPQEMASKETKVSITYVPGPDLARGDTGGCHLPSSSEDRQASTGCEGL